LFSYHIIDFYLQSDLQGLFDLISIKTSTRLKICS